MKLIKNQVSHEHHIPIAGIKGRTKRKMQYHEHLTYSLVSDPKGNIFLPKSILKSGYGVMYDHYGFLIQGLGRIYLILNIIYSELNRSM